VRPDNFTTGDSVDRMCHSVLHLAKRRDPERPLASLQPAPVLEEFSLVELSPRLHEPFLGLWEFTANAFNVVDGVNPHQVLVVRVKVRPVMGRARLRKHPDNDPIEPSNFRHRLSPDSYVAPSRLLPQTTPKE